MLKIQFKNRLIEGLAATGGAFAAAAGSDAITTALGGKVDPRLIHAGIHAIGLFGPAFVPYSDTVKKGKQTYVNPDDMVKNAANGLGDGICAVTGLSLIRSLMSGSNPPSVNGLYESLGFTSPVEAAASEEFISANGHSFTS